jgi:L-rhamnose-H+ transport protein
MILDPILGVCYHWIGGLASGSFYVPYKGVRKWSWETYWLVGGFFGWIVCPWLFASLLTVDLLGVLQQQSLSTLWWTYFFGTMWGVGALTFGLAVRYLGMSLGMGIALGYCAAFGTLLPPILKAFLESIPVAESILEIATTGSGQAILAGVGICLLGIVIAALAGLNKEREIQLEAKSESIAEFNFRRGILVATFSGIMSACFAFGLTAGTPMDETSRAAGTNPIWSGLPKLTVVVLGGFTTNLIWCAFLNFRNRSVRQYWSMWSQPNANEIGNAVLAPKVPLLANYSLSALAGTLWYFQFFFYTIGETKMGEFGFASWTLHMASVIVFSTMWGGILREWAGSSRKTYVLISLGILSLVLSSLVIGYGAFLKGQATLNSH